MALVFHRRLAIPLWALAFFTVAVTAPAPATLSLIAVRRSSKQAEGNETN
jgi:hypothetical protein